jgi:hypothetical protein
MKLATGRIVSIAITAGLWMLTGVRSVLDLIGYSTIPEDLGVAKTRLDQFFGWLVSAPWWAVLGVALLSTMWLAWVSWPRQIKQVDAAASSEAPQQPPPERADSNTKKPLQLGETDDQALLGFVCGHMIPTIERLRDVQHAIIIKATHGNGTLARLARDGWSAEFYQTEMGKGYLLLDGLSHSPPDDIAGSDLIQSVKIIEKTYAADLVNKTWELASHLDVGMDLPPICDRLEEWKADHLLMVEAYEQIKRNKAFGPLFRPLRPSRWGGPQPDLN